MLLSGSNVVTCRQIGYYLLPDPAAFENTRSRVGEAPFEIWYDTVVSGLLAQVTRILQVQLMICAALSPLLELSHISSP